MKELIVDSGIRTIKYPCQYLVTQVTGLESVIVPNDSGMIMYQVLEGLFGIVFNLVIMMVTINKDDIKFFIQLREIKFPAGPGKIHYIVQGHGIITQGIKVPVSDPHSADITAGHVPEL